MKEQELYDVYRVISYVVSGLALAFIIYNMRMRRIFKPYEYEMDKSMAFFYRQVKPVVEKRKDDFKLQKQYKIYRTIAILFGLIVVLFIGFGVIWSLLSR